jgi:hypothetical protein
MKDYRCQCGFPLNEERKCIACLPSQFRITTGRYNQSFIESLLNDSGKNSTKNPSTRLLSFEPFNWHSEGEKMGKEKQKDVKEKEKTKEELKKLKLQRKLERERRKAQERARMTMHRY